MRLPIVFNGKFGPIVHRFTDIAGFFAHYPTPNSTLFWGIPMDQTADAEVSLIT